MEQGDHGFRDQLGERIAVYREQRERIRAKLVELNHDLLDFDKRLDAAEELYRREFGLQPPGAEPRGRRRRTAAPPVAEAQPSWREAIAGVLSARGRPLHVKEIWDALLDAGFRTESQDPLRSIVAIAVRDPSIERTGPNTYTLTGSNGGSPQISIDRQSETVPREGGTS